MQTRRAAPKNHMNLNHLRILTAGLVLAVLSMLDARLSIASVPSTAFTYQGRLNDGTGPATGIYDLRFAIYDASANGNQAGNSVTNFSTAVTNGLFTVTLDFGGIFTGTNYWLDIGVRTNGGTTFTGLTPRQPVTPTPYAIFANSASNLLGNVPVGQLNGTIPLTQLPAAVVTNNASALNLTGSFGGSFNGAFTGNGSALVSINPSALSGTLAFSQLPAGIVTNNATGVTLSGTFSGNGAGLSSVNAASLNGITAPSFWQVGGNSFPANGIIGSLNNTPVEIRVNNSRVMRYELYVSGGLSSPNVIGGSLSNFVSSGVYGATIGGGGYAYSSVFPSGPNSVTGNSGTVSGGYSNTADLSGTVAGGANNGASTNATVGGGYGNGAGGAYAAVGGGQGNSAGGNHAVAAGGQGNDVMGNYSTVAGGQNNSAGSAYYLNEAQTNLQYATVGGGYNNAATGHGSFIGGGGYDGIAFAGTSPTAALPLLVAA